MRLRIARPSLLGGPGRMDGLSYVREDGDAIAIGALTRHHDLATSELLQERCNLLASTAAADRGPAGPPSGNDRRVSRARGSGVRPAHVLLALDADFVVTGPQGTRTIEAAHFFEGVFLTALGAQDVLTEIRVPAATGTYVKFHRRAQDWATVGVAVARLNGDVHVG